MFAASNHVKGTLRWWDIMKWNKLWEDREKASFRKVCEAYTDKTQMLLENKVEALHNCLSICESICSLPAIWWLWKWTGIQLYSNFTSGNHPTSCSNYSENNSTRCLQNPEWISFICFSSFTCKDFRHTSFNGKRQKKDITKAKMKVTNIFRLLFTELMKMFIQED